MRGRNRLMDQIATKLNMVAPAAIPGVNEELLIGKAKKGRFEMFLLSLSGGAFIGLGFIFFTTSQMGAGAVEWYGATKVVGGLVFSVGLVLVALTGGDLFTSTTMSVVPLIRKKLTGAQWISHWVTVYIGNIIGAVGLATLVYLGGTHLQGNGAWGAVTLNSALAKVSHTWVQAFVLGILANLAVCLAIYTSNAGRSLADKLLAITGPIALFVSTGFEHSVANMFMIPLGILIKGSAGGEFWSQTGLDQAAFADLTWVNFFVDNLLPVTLGNIVGGGVMIGVLYWTIFHFLDTPKDGAKGAPAAKS